MTAAILSFLGGAASVVAGVFAYKRSANKQRRDAEKDVADQQAQIDAKKREIHEAVYAKDDDKLNQLANRLLAPVLAVAAAFAVFGCTMTPNVVYVPTDRRIESCTNSIGISCKAVPDAVMADMLERLQRLKDLESEMAVDKRLGK